MNLLIELVKKDKMQGLQSILSLLAQMLDYIYHRTSLILLKIAFLALNTKILPAFLQRYGHHLSVNH